MLSDTERLQRGAANPRLVSLWRALGRLRSTVTVMNTGAHPDDEQSGMLAVLRHQHGARIVIACSTRGEGGQNALGRERGGALAMIRTREMEEAARVLDADIAWLGHGSDDPVHDFGFSKSGQDTLSRWGEDLILARLVQAYRRFRPDIVIPTFLDVPGQHGHHRAMTAAAQRAVAMAADPAIACDDLPPWQVAKLYFPAWSGGGGTYDDEVPPPPETTRIVARGREFASGMSYDRLGEVSRAFHASQGMGTWRQVPQQSWPLHLIGGEIETSPFDDLPARLSDLGTAPELSAADRAITAALAAFPHSDSVLPALLKARQAITGVTVKAQHAHRIARKLQELDAAIAIAADLKIAVAWSNAQPAPGEVTDLIVETDPGTGCEILVSLHPEPGIIAPPHTALQTGTAHIPLRIERELAISNRFAPEWLSLGGNSPLGLSVSAIIDGQQITLTPDPDEPLFITPRQPVSIAPEAVIVRLNAPEPVVLSVTGAAAEDLDIDGAKGLSVQAYDAALRLTPGPAPAPGHHRLMIRVNGEQAQDMTPISYPHIGRTSFLRPTALDVLALDLNIPDTRIGYFGAGADRVATWLSRMGARLRLLDGADFGSDLAGLDTVIFGIFAFAALPDRESNIASLHDWVRAGGHLVTLYHRPGDGWDPERTPPLPLHIGSPSLRWRVTDPTAEVTLLEPDHPLLRGPNLITAADFAGWHKERGLYFASDMHKDYCRLLSMSDPDEPALTGGLLSARIGLGRHTHCSLVLHHQMDQLVPGAFRLMANLAQAA